jgi:Tape measure protein
MPRGQKKINIIIAAKNSASKVIKSIKNQFTKLGDSVRGIFGPGGLIAGGIAGIGGGLLAKSFLDAARTTENYQVRLKVLLGSVEEGNRLFDDMAKYASKVPFELEEIMGGATQLAGILKGGVDEINQWIPLIGDLAAASGLGIRETTEQVSRMLSAGAASADLFRERGILSMLGFTAGVSYSAEETKKRLLAAWNETGSKFKGATDLMANTWDGTMSMFSDAWFSFRNAVANSGPFQAIKASLQGLLAEIDKLRQSGEFDRIATNFGEKILSGVKAFINVLPDIARGIVKGAEMLFLALSGWKQLRAAWEIMFTQARIWGLELINELRKVFIRLLEGLNRIPGVDTSQAIKDTYSDIGETFGRIDADGGLNDQLKEAKVNLGKIQIAQDEVAAKFAETSNTAATAMERVRQVALEGIQKAADASAAASKKTITWIDEENAALERQIAMRRELNRLARAGSSATSLEKSIETAERTE